MTSPPVAHPTTVSAVEAPPRRTRPGWLPVWSEDALLRGLRAMVVIPGLFAFFYEVVGNVQMATFASFGGFATLVLSRFAGTRRDKARAHLGLAMTGTALIVIGTLAASSTATAAIVTVPVAFAVLFAGVFGPNAAAGATGALLGYVLPVVSAGGAGTIPDRLAGWWTVSVVGTAAVLIFSPRAPADRLHETGARLASGLADEIDATLQGGWESSTRAVSISRKDELRGAFSATPYRPTGLAVADQALSNLVELLEWCTGLLGEVVSTVPRVQSLPDEDRALLRASSGLLRSVSLLLSGQPAEPDLDCVEHLLSSAAGRVRGRLIATGEDADAAHLTFHCRNLAVASRAAATDCLIACRRADEETINAARLRWYAAAPGDPTTFSPAGRILGGRGLAVRNASLRSIWFINSLRGALALAAAVAIADLSDVQHAFWVVLGTLSVLRTNAASTGATAIRAIAGTAVGFAVGAALVIGIGSDTTALWVMLPIAVFVAAYAPGTAPFAVGQAAFTVLLLVLFNLLVPVGWRVGVVRVEDVAIGCGVSILVGVFFWPRGAARVVGDDLADAFRQGSAYLSESVDWVLGRSPTPPTAGVASAVASFRLDDALRGLLTEQGSKRIPKEHLWSLVGSTMRLRLTAHALAGTHPAAPGYEAVREVLSKWTAGLSSWYDQVAAGLEGRTLPDRDALENALPAIPVDFTPAFAGTPVCTLWTGEHLRDLRSHLEDVIAPALEVSSLRHQPWWR